MLSVLWNFQLFWIMQRSSTTKDLLLHSFKTTSWISSTAACFLRTVKADNELELHNEQMKPERQWRLLSPNLWHWLTCLTAPATLSEPASGLSAVFSSVWSNRWELLWQFGLCGSQRKPRCDTSMPKSWPLRWTHTNMLEGRLWLWMEVCTQTCSFCSFPYGKLEGTSDAKMEQSPAKYVLPMVLTVNGGAQEDCHSPRGSPRSLSSQESDKSKLKESWWL